MACLHQLTSGLPFKREKSLGGVASVARCAQFRCQMSLPNLRLGKTTVLRDMVDIVRWDKLPTDGSSLFGRSGTLARIKNRIRSKAPCWLRAANLFITH